MAVQDVLKLITTRWGVRTLCVAYGGGKKDGFVATGVMEIIYESDRKDK